MGHRIRYRFHFADGSSDDYDVECDERSFALVPDPEAERPAWTRLGYSQCDNCPLDPAVHADCPAAVALVPLVRLCSRRYSHEDIRLEVETPERTTVKDTSVQRAFSSLLGLIMATSGCPHTRSFRPMARFHLPLADEDETLYRATSNYLLEQYFRRLRGEQVDLDLGGLAERYRALHEVNRRMARRLGAESEKDAAPNAVVLLDLFAKLLPMCIDERLADLRHLFDGNDPPAPPVPQR